MWSTIKSPIGLNLNHTLIRLKEVVFVNPFGEKRLVFSRNSNVVTKYGFKYIYVYLHFHVIIIFWTWLITNEIRIIFAVFLGWYFLILSISNIELSLGNDCCLRQLSNFSDSEPTTLYSFSLMQLAEKHQIPIL